MRDNIALRFLGSLVVALCIVLTMLWLGLEVSGFGTRDDGRELQTHDVTLLTDAERLDLQALLGEGRFGLEAPAQPAPVEQPARASASRGFVRLDVRVDARGNVADVRVIDADPLGIYEARAVADVRRRRYSPDVVDGVPVPSRHLEIVDFMVTPADDAAAGRE